MVMLLRLALTDLLCSAVMARILIPNAETVAIVKEIHARGCFHAGLRWGLTKRRMARSSSSRKGGLWRWMELSLADWVVDVCLRNILVAANPITSIPRRLQRLRVLTPMGFVLKEPLDPDQLTTLAQADRGVIVFEIHSSAYTIRDEAARVLQMFFRRLHRRSRATRLLCDHTKRRELRRASQPQVEFYSLEEVQTVTRCVMDALDDLVEAVVVKIRREQYERMMPQASSDVPVRTENRHRLDDDERM